ncbi:MAG: hypothetical protein ABI863_18185 [Ginsengibacter sp.]
MTKNIPLLLLLFLICSKVSAGDSTIIYKKKSTFFIEAGGKGPYYSVNYGRIFRQGKKLIYSWRAGFSLLPHDLSVPLAISAFTAGLRHHFEFSLGLTPYLKDYKTFLHKPDLSDKQIYITPGIGYRFQKNTSNFFLSIGVDPLIFMDPPSDYFWNFRPQLKPSAHFAFGFLF